MGIRACTSRRFLCNVGDVKLVILSVVVVCAARMGRCARWHVRREQSDDVKTESGDALLHEHVLGI